MEIGEAGANVSSVKRRGSKTVVCRNGVTNYKNKRIERTYLVRSLSCRNHSKRCQGGDLRQVLTLRVSKGGATSQRKKDIPTWRKSPYKGARVCLLVSWPSWWNGVFNIEIKNEIGKHPLHACCPVERKISSCLKEAKEGSLVGRNRAAGFMKGSLSRTKNDGRRRKKNPQGSRQILKNPGR